MIIYVDINVCIYIYIHIHRSKLINPQKWMVSIRNDFPSLYGPGPGYPTRQASDESSSETLQAYREAFLQVARGPQRTQVGHSGPMTSPIWETFEQMEQQQCDVTILCNHQITIK